MYSFQRFVKKRMRLAGIEWDEGDFFGSPFAELRVSYWPLAVLLATYPVIALVRGRRKVPGACRACGYDLTGNVSGRCPECGRPTAAG